MRSPVFRLAGLVASLFAILVTAGAHWYVLQSVAWARMLAQYSRSASFSQAVEKTFDGKHPCSLCLRVRDGQKEQERGQPKLPPLRTEATSDLFFFPSSIAAPDPPLASMDAVPFVPNSLSDEVHSPPKPPPRS